jgi:hypothetical protein
MVGKNHWFGVRLMASMRFAREAINYVIGTTDRKL